MKIEETITVSVVLLKKFCKIILGMTTMVSRSSDMLTIMIALIMSRVCGMTGSYRGMMSGVTSPNWRGIIRVVSVVFYWSTVVSVVFYWSTVVSVVFYWSTVVSVVFCWSVVISASDGILVSSSSMHVLLELFVGNLSVAIMIVIGEGGINVSLSVVSTGVHELSKLLSIEIPITV